MMGAVMRMLINYANDQFTQGQKLNSKTGREVGGFDEVISYSPDDLEQGFYESNAGILNQSRGAGYWLWKPYLIYQTLQILNRGDFLFYCDSGSYFINPIDPMIEIAEASGQDILVFELEHIEKVWTKRDAFVLMDCDRPEYTDSKQRLASFCLFRKSRFTMTFAGEYLSYAQDERVLTDLDNRCGYPNYPEFKDHRHDQSILSLLSKRHGIKAFRDPSQWGNDAKQRHADSGYGQIIQHTRQRNAQPTGSRRSLFSRVSRKIRS